MRPITVARVSFVIASVALAACGATTTPGEVGGEYALRSVDNKALPAVLVPSTTQCNFAALEGTIVIDAGEYTARTGYGCFPDPSVRSESSESGAYSRAGSTLTLNRNGGGQYSATIGKDGALSLSRDGSVWTYRR